MKKRQYVYIITDDIYKKNAVLFFIQDDLFNELMNITYRYCYIELERYYNSLGGLKKERLTYYIDDKQQIDILITKLVSDVCGYTYCSLKLVYELSKEN